MPVIFISYRRQDSEAYAGRLYDRRSAAARESTLDEP